MGPFLFGPLGPFFVMGVYARQSLTNYRLIRPSVEALDVELWGVELSGSGKDLKLVIYIEREGGVNVDHCADVSRQVSGVLDVEDPITEAYQLGVFARLGSTAVCPKALPVGSG